MRLSETQVPQLGLMVFITRTIGFLLSAVGILYLSLVAIALTRIILAGQGSLLVRIDPWLEALAFGSLCLLLGPFWLGMYPNITYSDQGIRARIGYIGYRVGWREVVGFGVTRDRRHKRRTVLKFNRKGMFFNRFYGILTGSLDRPVIMLASRIQDIAVLENEIVHRNQVTSQDDEVAGDQSKLPKTE